MSHGSALRVPSTAVSSERPPDTVPRAEGQRGRKSQEITAKLAPALVFCVLLAGGWELIARKSASPLIPDLGDIGTSFLDIVLSGQAFSQTGITLQRILSGFVVAFVASCVIGFCAARNKLVEAFVEPGLLLGLTVPGLVWALLCVIWFGVGLATPVVTVALCIAPTLIVSIKQGVRSTDPKLLEMTTVYQFSRFQRLRYFWLPALAPFWLSGTRIALSHAWKVIVLVELFGLSDGIGYQLNSQFSSQNVAGMLAWTLVLWITIVLMEYFGLKILERKVNVWQKSNAI